MDTTPAGPSASTNHDDGSTHVFSASRRGVLLGAGATMAMGLAGVPVVSGRADAARLDGAEQAAATLRRLSLHPERFQFELTSGPGNWFEIRTGTGPKPLVRGNSPVALVRGVYHYLNRTGHAAIAWEGDRVALPDQMPAWTLGRVETPFRHRVYLNTCTYGYTTPWWDWARWEREIDWMAANGIDMPLALEGQEYVWRALWREAWLSEEEIAASLSGPAFLPWHRMGNIEGYRAPLPTGWIDRKHALQLKILARMRGMGMRPVLPAFAGYVPTAFARRHTDARIYKMRSWEGFEGTSWLDPSDPLFARLSKRFIEIYTQTYGPGEYYLADAFNEMTPPIADDGSDVRDASYGDATANTAKVSEKAKELPREVRDARLGDYGERLYKSIANAAPDAKWVMQGWMFGADKAFWTPDAIKAFLARVPAERMLVLDIGNDRYPGIWRNTEAFNGKSWIYGYVHNYGGSNPVYGDLDFYRQDLTAIRANPGRGSLSGVGLFPEGLHSSSIVYANVSDLAWGTAHADTAAWLRDYLRARYGRVTPEIERAWASVAKGVFATKYWTPRWWNERAGAYLFFKRPNAAAKDYPDEPGDRAALLAGIDGLSKAAATGASPLLVHDLIDLATHYALTDIDRRLRAALTAYDRGDATAGDAAAAPVAGISRAVDELLGNQQETLASWIDDARRYADTPQEAAAYVANAKAQVTIWGGEGHLADYASKRWQGLVGEFYLPRWQTFLAARRQAALSGKAFDDAAMGKSLAAWEQAWVDRDGRYTRRRPSAPVDQVAALMRMIAR